MISTPVSVEFDDKQLEEYCSCGGRIDYTNYSHSYKPTRLRGRAIWIIITIVLVILGVSFFLYSRVSRTHTSEDLAYAAQETNTKSAAEILQDFQQAGITDETLARLFHSSKWTLKRIRDRQTNPVMSFDATLKGAYYEFVLFDRRKTLFLWTLRMYPGTTDQYFAYKDPSKEQEVE
jgi:hypothetical protein